MLDTSASNPNKSSTTVNMPNIIDYRNEIEMCLCQELNLNISCKEIANIIIQYSLFEGYFDQNLQYSTYDGVNIKIPPSPLYGTFRRIPRRIDKFKLLYFGGCAFHTFDMLHLKWINPFVVENITRFLGIDNGRIYCSFNYKIFSVDLLGQDLRTDLPIPKIIREKNSIYQFNELFGGECFEYTEPFNGPF